MTIQQLDYLLEVNRSKSITTAAKKLYITQGSLSKAISTLEKELGFPIFSRTRNGVVPTDRGLEVLEYAGRICADHRAMLEGKKTKRREVRLKVPPYRPFQEAFLRLTEEYREDESVRISLMSSAPLNQRFRQLTMFELDLYVYMPLSPSIHAKGMEAEAKELEWCVLGSVPAVIRIGRGHPLYEKPDLSPADFAKDILIDSASGLIATSTMVMAFVPINSERALYISDVEVRSQLLQKGLGYSIGFQSRAEELINIREIPIPGLSFDFMAITNPARPLSPVVQRYLELAKEELARMAANHTNEQ